MTKFEKFMMNCIIIQLFMFIGISIKSMGILMLGHKGAKE